MESADARLKSFTQKTRSWPHSSDTYKATPSTLADAGFFWRPVHSTDDNVICFLCGKSLDGWTDTDDPYDEHFSHSRRCAWAIVKTIPIFEDELPFRWDDEEELPRGERMAKARLETFGKWWPHERTKGWFGTTKRMANAGFFYAPTSDSIDNVQCPYCYLALDGWEAQDDPVNEHQRRQPTCPFFATRVTAPTKSSSAKATKSKQKASMEAKEIQQWEQQPQQGLLLSPRSQHVHSITMDNQNERKNSLTMRLSKTPIPDSSSFASMEQQSRDSTQSRSSNLTSVMKKTSKSGQQLASPAHSVEFDLQGDVTTTQPTKKSKGKAAASRDIDQEENDTSRTRRVEIEQVETTVGTTTRSTASSVSESSSGRLLSQTTTTARKRYNLDSPDLPSSTSSEISSGSRQSSTSNVSVVIVKKRRLARVESAVEVDAITDNASDGSGETDIPNFEDVRISTNSTSALSQPKALQRRKVVKVELFGEDESQQQQQLQLQGAGEPSQPTKKRGRPKKKIEEDNESESLPTARSKRKTAVRATKQGGRSTSLLKSTATKKAPKALIEIFDLPDEEMENNDKPEPEPKESGNEPEHMQVDAPSVAEDRVQSLDHPAPTNATTDAQESANEEIYPTAASNDQPRTQEVTATVNTDSSPHDSSRVDVTTPAEPPVTTEEHAIAPIEHLSTPVKRRGRSYSPILYSTTPVRQQAVSLLDIEYADVVVIDPKTPNRRMASRMDIEGWEDEDRRESLQTRLSSPFISPSQWEFDGSLSTSTPKPKRTPVRLVPGITPRQRVKDMVGNSSAFSNPGSPSFKKTRLNLLSPENNHEELVDRLGGLMKEYDSSQVMAAAELALKEEVKLLRRSQNKERKLAAAAAAAASAAPSETPFGPPSEAQEDDDLLMLEPESSNSNSNKSNILGTPVKNAGVSLMFESTTPGTPLSRTPLPISKVISAIGAASRRNPNAHVSPFVRTPAKKTVDLLRLEDLETDEDTSLRQKERDRTRVNRDAQDVNPFVDSHHSQIMEPVRMAGSRREPAFDPPASQKRRSSSDHLGPKDLTKPSAKPSHSLRDPEEPVESRSGAQLSLEEQDRRRRLMGECGISGREITMSVEEFHRHCADEQIRLFELQCEAWIQRFLEEAERVRNAIMDDGRR